MDKITKLYEQLFELHLWENHRVAVIANTILLLLEILAAIVGIGLVFWHDWWWKMVLVTVTVWIVHSYIYNIWKGVKAQEFLNNNK